MQKAKAAVDNFVAKAGHHDTTVHETVSPAVQHETVRPTTHEEVITATDREVHQDHYHRTVQPVQDREVLPEKHEHNLGAVQHREFDHRDHEGTKQKLAAEAEEFRDHRIVHDTKHTQSTGGAVGGEHVHHHIHENIQPVVHKETIQPTVVHTTVPIHEVHHNAATHHSTSELPPVTMADFKSKGGALTGREERYDGFEGEPKNIGSALGTGHSTHSHSHGHHSGTTGVASTGAAGLAAREAGSHHHQGEGLRSDGEKYGNTGTGQLGSIEDTTRTHSGPGSHGQHSTGNTTTDSTTGQKPSMMQKLNPFTDADKDGKKGFMN